MSGVLKLIRGLDAFSSQYVFQLGVGCAIVYFFMAAGNMMNDYFDRELDKINHPERPIPSGGLQAKDVIITVGLIYLLLILLGILVNLMMLIILVIALMLMVGYEVSLKRQGFIGNITISILVALLFMFGAAAVSEFGVVLFLSLLAFLATLTREIVKDIEDIEGDIDRITLPKKIGIKPAGMVAGISMAIAIILSPIPVYQELLPVVEFTELGIYYLYLILPADILFVVSIAFYTKNPKAASQALKGGMVLALVAFVLGGIFV
jgi:geranylgeranylglycerol-phosphate geranylgeranyltransferase